MSEIVPGTITSMDYTIFQLINGLSGKNIYHDAFSVFLAEHLIYIMAFVTLCLVIHWRKYWARAILGTGIAYGVNLIIGHIYFRPRPFVFHNVVQLISKSSAEKSFPSGHATAAFALAFSVYFINKKWGVVLLIMALLVSFGRILVGVHYPLDVLGGAFLGLVFSYLAKLVDEKLWRSEHLNDNNSVTPE